MSFVKDGLNGLSSYSPVAAKSPIIGCNRRFGDGIIDGPDGLAPVTKVFGPPPEY